MGQTYPRVITKAMVDPVDWTVARPIPPEISAGTATKTVAYEPDTWAEKATNHPAGDPDFVFATLNTTISSNEPYGGF
jgi:hypothetical protein